MSRLKKREADRVSQRNARERKKSRIAHLEALVESFQHQDANDQITKLTKQLDQVERERNLLTKTLKKVRLTLDTILSTEDQPAKDGHSSENTTECDPNNNLHCNTVNIPQSRIGIEDSKDVADQVNGISIPENVPALKASEFYGRVAPIDNALMDHKANMKTAPVAMNYAPNWANPSPFCSCRLETCPQQSMEKSEWRNNHWAYANEVLSERFDWNANLPPATEDASDDVPIRALVEGWDSVARREPLHPSWQILRRIDQVLFITCHATERLAILRAMHLLLQFHTEPTIERYNRLPPWYTCSRYHSIAHSYAIDFFAWPGLRERFIFNEHQYCGNEFWYLFCGNLKILWPYSLRDCYLLDNDTGLYKLSPIFDQRLGDIKCWTMGPDIFQRFPELSGDIPAFNYVSRKLLYSSSMPTLRAEPANSSEKVQQSTRESPIMEDRLHNLHRGTRLNNWQHQTLQQGGQRPLTVQHGGCTDKSAASVLDPNHPLSLRVSFAQVKSQNTRFHDHDATSLNHINAVDAFVHGVISEEDFDALYTMRD